MVALLASPAGGQSPADDALAFRLLDTSDGLSQNFVTAIAQDAEGFMWLGTLGGVDLFDGRRFVSHRHDPDWEGSLSRGNVLSLHVDAAGNVWVGTESGLDRYEPSSNSFRHYYPDPADPGSLTADPVGIITSDREGHLWFGQYALHRLDPASGTISRYELGGRELSLLHVDDADRLWVGTAPLGLGEAGSNDIVELQIFDDCSLLPTEELPPPDYRMVSPSETGHFVAIAEDEAQRVWLGQQGGGLIRFDPGKRTSEPPWTVSRPTPLQETRVRSLSLDSTGTLWALAAPPKSDDPVALPRLYRIDAESMAITEVDLHGELPRFQQSAPLHHLASDRFGGLWIATNANGLLHADVASSAFGLYRPDEGSGHGSRFVRAIHATRDGTLWIGTPSGLDKFDRLQGSARPPLLSDSTVPALPDPNVQAILEDRTGAVWIGTSGGLVRFEPDSGRVEDFRSDLADPGALGDDWIQVIHEDPRGTLWFGTLGGGLDVYDGSTGQFRHFRSAANDPDSLPSNTVETLYSDRSGRLWVGTTRGAAVAESAPLAETRFRRVSLAEGANEGSVLAFRERSREPDVLWVGQLGLGVTRLDIQTGEARRFTTRNSGLPDDTVYGILEDREGRLWMSTNRGLARFDVEAATFDVFGLELGLQSLEFNARSHHQATDGEMFFGGVAGLNYFHPERIGGNPYPPQARITTVSVLDRSTRGETALFRPIHRIGMPGESLVLGPHQRDLRFELAALHFSDGSNNRFAYMLENFDAAWREPVVSDEVIYTNLDPGTYTFRLRAISSHGVASEDVDSVTFVIGPPFYATAWFLGLCAICVLGALTGGYVWRVDSLRRRQRRLERQVDARTIELRRALSTVENQAQKLQELDAAKSRFFANISHEFRTPLTLTLGPLGDLRSGRHGTMTPEAAVEIDRAIRHTRGQLQLVDQLLTLSALDAGQLPLETRRKRLQEVVRRVAAEFEGHAQRQGVELRLDPPREAIWVAFDEEKIRQVLSNLLDNAIRFTKSGGRVIVRWRAVDSSAVLEVEDTGVGISRENLPRVFDRFYGSAREHRGQLGTGVGLSLCKELVELHGGSIRVESEEGVGARFTVELPRCSCEAGSDELQGAVQTAPEEELHGTPSGPSLRIVLEGASSGFALPHEPSRDDRPKVLLVEDHPEMCAYLREHLDEDYQVVTAGDGSSGLQRAREEMPDLVLSDVMMPGMDGYELCAALREDRELEQVPVILLTARGDLESKLEGLERGADAYLPKPFVREELLATVRNLLRGRERLRARLQQEFQRSSLGPGPIQAPSEEDAFLDRIHEVLERRSFEEEFSVGELANELYMSRSNLHRRVGEQLNTTPSELLMEWRLERAAQLLDRRAGTVAEVAFAVGFKNVSHFIKRFRMRHGKTPASYAAEGHSSKV